MNAFMSKTIISDTSCFIVLSKIGHLDILQKLFNNIITTPEIAAEFGNVLPNWIELIAVKDKYKQQLLETQIDKGEASAIALALEMENPLLIIDDYKARKLAKTLQIDYTGTVGIIILAKQKGVINAIKPFLEKIKTTNFHISEELERFVLNEANEL
jgi:predicted nucleic acid-binding protein